MRFGHDVLFFVAIVAGFAGAGCAAAALVPEVRVLQRVLAGLGFAVFFAITILSIARIAYIDYVDNCPAPGSQLCN